MYDNREERVALSQIFMDEAASSVGAWGRTGRQQLRLECHTTAIAGHPALVAATWAVGIAMRVLTRL